MILSAFLNRYQQIHIPSLRLTGLLILFLFSLSLSAQDSSWIRINQLGYTPSQKKVAVLVAKTPVKAAVFSVKKVDTDEVIYKGRLSADFGAYGPFAHGFRLDFSTVDREGEFYIQAGGTRSPNFRINRDIYKGSADFILRYMRQQRSLFNPFLQDSCHTHDGFTLYAEKAGIKDSTRIDVGGGWHDASDYLQYATTSANATYHLLAAYRDFPAVFEDEKQASGLEGSNGIPDVLDEAKWGLDWLQKMHPEPHLLFNQIGDDRDHAGMRMPGEDPFYGRGYERPVYFVDGNPQQRGKFLNDTRGTSSTAAKFSSAFNLGAEIWTRIDHSYAETLTGKAQSALDYAQIKLGVTQTVSVKSPYIYAEENWKDDMELALAGMYAKTGEKSDLEKALQYAREEPVTPWMVRDTASHYQYYPFINLGHYELAKQAPEKHREELLSYYKNGITAVWNRAKNNAFYRGVPFIWCSNNLTVSFAIQVLWYAELSGDDQFLELAQANIDWLFGVNPWGASMIYGFPENGDTPTDPHSAFTQLKNYPIDGGLVDGPVYTGIFENLIGIELHREDPYAEFQSDLAVYHDDFGDYSTNEPTMDGTASLVYLMAALENKAASGEHTSKISKDTYGAILRGDPSQKHIALVFTAHDLGEGYEAVRNTLAQEDVKAAFFFTGEYLQENEAKVVNLSRDGHYIGPHSFAHLLYADWDTRQTLVTEQEFKEDLRKNQELIEKMGMHYDRKLFMPAYEWHNKDVVNWAADLGTKVFNYTPGLRTAADYTYPEMQGRYLSTEAILKDLWSKESAEGLNGYIILIHLGTDQRRKDKLYTRLSDIIRSLKDKGYTFRRIDRML